MREFDGCLMGLGGCALITLLSLGLSALEAWLLLAVWNALGMQPQLTFWTAFGLITLLSLVAGLFIPRRGARA